MKLWISCLCVCGCCRLLMLPARRAWMPFQRVFIESWGLLTLMWLSLHQVLFHCCTQKWNLNCTLSEIRHSSFTLAYMADSDFRGGLFNAPACWSIIIIEHGARNCKSVGLAWIWQHMWQPLPAAVCRHTLHMQFWQEQREVILSSDIQCWAVLWVNPAMSISLQGQLRQRSGKMQWVIISRLGRTRARLAHSFRTSRRRQMHWLRSLAGSCQHQPLARKFGRSVHPFSEALMLLIFAGRSKYRWLTNSTRQQWECMIRWCLCCRYSIRGDLQCTM